MSQRGASCRWASAGLSALGLLLWPTATPAECVDYRTFMHWEESLELPAPAIGLVIDDSTSERAYAVITTGIAALTLADPSAPALLDTLDLWDLSYERAAIARSGNRLWVAARDAGIFLIQTDPLVLTNRIQTPGEPRDIAIEGGLAVVADWDEGLQLYRTQGSSPARLGGIDLPGFASAVEVHDDRAYVADLLGVTVIDVSTPAAPQILGSITLPGLSLDLTIQNGFAYVVGTRGLHTVDVSDPQHLALIDTLPLGGSQILANDTHAMLCSTNALAFLDIEDPRKPALFAQVEIHDGAMGVAAMDDRLYFAGFSLQVLNHEHYAMPPFIGRFEDRVSGYQAIAVDGHLACAAGHDGLAVFDLSDPAYPVLAGQIAQPEVRTLTVSGQYAYMLTIETLVVCDLTIPASPTLIGRAKTLWNPIDCAYEAGYLYLISPSYGLQVVDVTEPATPIVRGSWDPLGSFGEVCTVGSLVYMAGYGITGQPTLLIVDVGDPTAPHPIGSYEFGNEGSIESLIVQDNLAYMIVGAFYGTPGQLAIVDVSIPSQPTLRTLVDLPSLPAFADELELIGSQAYLWGETDLTILDVSDPDSPWVISTRMDVNARGLSVTNEWIAVTTGYGLEILPLQCQTPAPVELASFAAEPQPGAIRLTWQTAREWDHLGFHLERAPAASGVFERLTRTLIEPPGPYAFLDREVEPGTTYYYRLEALNRRGGSDRHGPWPTTALPGSGPTAAPLADHLAECHPNPFAADAPSTEIAFSVAQSGPVRLRLIDATGRVVATLVDRALPAGRHQATWDGRTARGEMAAAGIYFYRLEAGDFTATRQLVRLR